MWLHLYLIIEEDAWGSHISVQEIPGRVTGTWTLQYMCSKANVLKCPGVLQKRFIVARARAVNLTCGQYPWTRSTASQLQSLDSLSVHAQPCLECYKCTACMYVAWLQMHRCLFCGVFCLVFLMFRISEMPDTWKYQKMRCRSGRVPVVREEAAGRERTVKPTLNFRINVCYKARSLNSLWFFEFMLSPERADFICRFTCSFQPPPSVWKLLG